MGISVDNPPNLFSSRILTSPPPTDFDCLPSYNNVRALDEQALQFRADEGIDIGGLYFSTFFGGSDASWAPSSDMHAYFRGIELYGSTAPSNLTGDTASGALSIRPNLLASSVWGIATLAIVAVFGGTWL